MRAVDREEIFNIRGHDNPYILAHEVTLAAATGCSNIEYNNNKPASILGATPIHPGVWSFWSFGTDDWPKTCLRQTRWAFKKLRPLLLERGAHRAQCESRFDHVDAHNWLRSCGAKCEAILEGFGRDGSNYFLFSWRK